jgi:hypothetical protein
MFLCLKLHESITNSLVHSKAAAANYAAVPSPGASHINFDWFEAAENAVAMDRYSHFN